MARTERVVRFVACVGALAIGVATITACTEHEGATEPSSGKPTAAQLAEARRLIDPESEPVPPTAAQVDCVARVVVMNPDVDEIANDMAQTPNKDLREVVMIDYLTCAYDFVLNLYMRFAPASLTPEMKKCVRSKFTELTVKRLAEVIVEDPDAGYTGPLIISVCETGRTDNPLKNGTIPSMGGS